MDEYVGDGLAQLRFKSPLCYLPDQSCMDTVGLVCAKCSEQGKYSVFDVNDSLLFCCSVGSEHRPRKRCHRLAPQSRLNSRVLE